MKSKIDIIEFRNRLKENTKIGFPKLRIPIGIFSIFTDNTKYFYGDFDNSTFEITTNNNFMPSFYFLKGKYIKKDKILNINYIIEPVGKFRIAWIKYFPIITLISFNSIFYFEIKPQIEIYLMFNIFLVLISVLSRLNIKWQNKKIQNKFNEIFEIIE